jgi:hypothetical protein
MPTVPVALVLPDGINQISAALHIETVLNFWLVCDYLK